MLETIAALESGAPLHAYIARPEGRARAGVLVLHTAFGLRDDFRRYCDDLAQEGFLACAPDLFPGQVTDSWQEAEARAAANPSWTLVPKAVAAFHWLYNQNPSGQIGLVGFSLGGALALRTANTGIGQAVVTYYGSPCPDPLPNLQRPVLGHFAADDPFEPVNQVAAWFRGLPEAEMRVYPGVRHCFAEPSMDSYDATAAAMARAGTLAFLKEHLLGLR